jgi:hypothetical protein
LLPLVLVPQWLSKQARWDALRSHVAEIGQLAATVVDGDLHRQLVDPANYSDDLYARALAPLVRFHSGDPNIFYLYTMVDRDGVPYFVLDSAKSLDLRTNHKLRASDNMERFDIREEYQDDWLSEIASGKTYVTPNYEEDDYGNFLTAHAPIYNSQRRWFLGTSATLTSPVSQTGSGSAPDLIGCDLVKDLATGSTHSPSSSPTRMKVSA